MRHGRLALYRTAKRQWHLDGLVQLTTQQFCTAVTTEHIWTQATVGYKGHSCTTARSTGEHKQGASRRTQTSASAVEVAATPCADAATATTPAQVRGLLLANAVLLTCDECTMARAAELDAICNKLRELQFRGIFLITGNCCQLGPVLPKIDLLQQPRYACARVPVTRRCSARAVAVVHQSPCSLQLYLPSQGDAVRELLQSFTRIPPLRCVSCCSRSPESLLSPLTHHPHFSERSRWQPEQCAPVGASAELIRAQGTRWGVPHYDERV